SKSKSSVKVSLKIDKRGLPNADTVNIEVYHFFDRKDFAGSVSIATAAPDDASLDYTGPAEPAITLPSASPMTTGLPFTYEAEISADFASDSDYLIYLGSALVATIE
ncbi:MAG: hypothetical protein ACP5E4_02790, partial [Candidatus Aenigmatarchaeota archaeon]